MTNKSFIVKYVFVVVDVNINENIDESNAFTRNFDINFDKRETFDFDIIVAQNICVFDVANNVANKIKLNILIIANEINIVDEIKKI